MDNETGVSPVIMAVCGKGGVGKTCVSALIARVSIGQSSGKADLVSMLEYEIFSALAERKNLAFLAIGRPETEGCKGW